LVALSNIKSSPLTTISVINYDRRVIGKMIKYCLKYDPESAEKYFQFAQVTVNNMKDCWAKAEYYLLIADALSKSEPECAFDSALKGFNILYANKKNYNSTLNLKAIKILSNLIPINACTVEKLFSKDDPLKISTFYSIYKTWGEKENCRKKISKYIYKKKHLSSDERKIAMRILNYDDKRDYNYLNTIVKNCIKKSQPDNSSPVIDNFVTLCEIYHIYSNPNFNINTSKILFNYEDETTSSLSLNSLISIENNRSRMENTLAEYASKTLDIIDYRLTCKMTSEEYIDSCILVGKNLKKDQPFLATKYFLNAFERLQDILDPFHKLSKICDIYRHSICFSKKELNAGYKEACNAVNKIDSDEKIILGLSMILTNKGLKPFVIDKKSLGATTMGSHQF
ncbi:MAG: hypothetical protein H0U49_05470, partial [Parachlamydiaceae bacterium]|nr:hypothetical protein [Parachlamydiaceae bacterium]